MFRWENPSVFWLLGALPLFWIWTAWTWRSTRRRLDQVLGSRLAPFLSSSISHPKRKWNLFLRSMTILFLICALARPQSGESKQEIKSQGVEIMFAVDVSESMLSEDVRPSRLDQAKVELSRILDLMPGNKVGIVAFAGSSALLSPLTVDPTALKMYLDSLSPLSVSSQGTNFKSALEESKAAFERGGVGQDERSSVTRVILIASDGEDHEPGALDQAQKLAKEGIRIFSLAYGTEKGGPIPERDSMGYLRGYKKDSSGQTVLTTVKGDALKMLAQAGQGSFYHAALGGSHVQNLIEDIGRLEKTEFESQMAVQYEEKFQWLLFAAFLVWIVELVLGQRRGQFVLWRGRYEVPPA